MLKFNLEIIDWLNKNQGFVMILLTIIYVIATLIIVIYNRKSIQQFELAREEEARPYIFLNLYKDPRDEWFSLRIKNYGKTGGKIKFVNITPSVHFSSKINISELLKDFVMAPSQLMNFTILNQKKEIYDIMYFTINIKYSPTYNLKKEYNETYTVSANFGKGLAYTDKTRTNTNIIENEMINISQHLDSIRNKM